jgi:hypothetical protein
MALGTRAPNEPKQTDVYAELPRDLNTRLATKTVAGLKAVFCSMITAKPDPNTELKSAGARHLTPAINGGPTGTSGGGRRPERI